MFPPLPPPKPIVMADAEAVAVTAAARLLARIQDNPDRPAICLTGGTSPLRLYELLGGKYRDRIPWDRTHWFIGDERFVPADDHLNNMRMARTIFLDQCAPAAHIHAIPTDAGSPDAAARGYERELRAFHGRDRLDPLRPLFDLVLMGIAPDGHTASLFPGAATLDERDRWTVGVEQAKFEPFVPRITLTCPALASCREMLFLVTGADKCAVMARLDAGDDLPAARVRSHHMTTWLCDAAAAARPCEARLPPR